MRKFLTTIKKQHWFKTVSDALPGFVGLLLRTKVVVRTNVSMVATKLVGVNTHLTGGAKARFISFKKIFSTSTVLPITKVKMFAKKVVSASSRVNAITSLFITYLAQVGLDFRVIVKTSALFLFLTVINVRKLVVQIKTEAIAFLNKQVAITFTVHVATAILMLVKKTVSAPTKIQIITKPTAVHMLSQIAGSTKIIVKTSAYFKAKALRPLSNADSIPLSDLDSLLLRDVDILNNF